jgi:hypothetical protein
MVVKSFRGLLADGGQDQIHLSTIRGKMGYRIIKFALMPASPGTTSYEDVVKIYMTKQTSITATVDFSESDLLGVAYLEGNNANNSVDHLNVIFDNQVVNQDIYVTHVDADTGASVNYYIELEVIPLTDHAAEYTTIKDIRVQRTD